MSPIAAGLDLLLVALLLSALYLGLRLNGRLKSLREGHAGFVRAVAELDSAAARAESGLKALRAASEETHDALLHRIETARGLIARLDTASEKAARLVEPTATPAAPAAFAPSPESRPAPRFPVPLRRQLVRSVDDDLFEAAEPAPAQRRLDGRP
jgi:hypothetical protein